jgi:transposase
MIAIPSGSRVWIATGHTDMRRGMQGLALQVQEGLRRDPHGGDLFIFRGRRGDLAKILWHDGIGLSLYAKRLDRGRFIWPSAPEGAVSISAAQMRISLAASAGFPRRSDVSHPRTSAAADPSQPLQAVQSEHCAYGCP